MTGKAVAGVGGRGHTGEGPVGWVAAAAPCIVAELFNKRTGITVQSHHTAQMILGNILHCFGGSELLHNGHESVGGVNVVIFIIFANIKLIQIDSTSNITID